MIRNKRGTAEIVGTSLFLVILLFFFTNVILWYDISARQAESVMLDKINSPISIAIFDQDPLTFRVRSIGIKDVQIVRVRWIEAANDNHGCVDIERLIPIPVFIQSGWYIDIKLVKLGEGFNFYPENRTLTIEYSPPKGDVTFKVFTNLGNSAVYRYSFR
ncbi:hypothetical protein KEJ21_04700 [Candidatus Bathyarchaeota archaeon]|nr:hypothetical protein [Candidatus Bathyarchaeota archaeon]MBS7630250.1 hypothetical protein [Candidatus Bathyarchaeota archaeon]